MTEQYVNFGETTLAEALDASETGVDVTTGSVFPSSGNFRVVVDDEIMLATARSTNTLTVERGAEGTTAATHDTGAAIALMLTAASLTNIVQENGVGTGVVGARVYKSGYQNDLAANTDTKITFESVDFDTDNFFDNANDRLTVPTGLAGKYLVCGVVCAESGAAGEVGMASVRKNGSTYQWVSRGQGVGSSAPDDYRSFAFLVNLAAADYLELYFQPGNTSSADIRGTSAFTTFAIYKLGSGSVAGLDTARYRSEAGGNFTLNSTSWTNVDTGTDLVVPAQAGDVLEVGINVIHDSGTTAYLDVATIVSGSPVNFVSGGGGTSGEQGLVGWRCETGITSPISGVAQYVVQTGDISGGNVTLRLRYRTFAATDKILYRSSGVPFAWHVINLRAGTINRRRGTAFPTGPASGDEYFRTDIRGGMLFRYTGTRWVSDQEFNIDYGDGGPYNATFTYFKVIPHDYAMHLTRVDWEFYGASESWSCLLQTGTFTETYTTVTGSTRSSSSHTDSRWYGYSDALDYVVDGTGGNTGSTIGTLALAATRSSGTTYIGCRVAYRLIAT